MLLTLCLIGRGLPDGSKQQNTPSACSIWILQPVTFIATPHYKLLLQDSRVLRSAASRTLSQFDFFKTQQPLPFLERKMNKNYNFEDAMLVPTSLMAEMFSISPRWFRQLAVSAGCQPSCRNAWPLGPTLRAILAYQQTNRELAAEPSETDKVTHARTRQIETNIARIEASHISACQ